MKHKKLTALILCFTMLFSITSGIFSAALAADSTTDSAYSLDTTTDSVYSLDTTTDSADSTDYVWDSTTESAVEEEKGPMLFSTKAKAVEVAEEEETTVPDYSAYAMHKGMRATFGEYGDIQVYQDKPTTFKNDEWILYSPSESNERVLFEITDYTVVHDYYDITVTDTDDVIGVTTVSSLWYQLDIVSGEAIGEDDTVFQNGFWVFQNFLAGTEPYEYDALTLLAPEVGKIVQFKTDIYPSLYPGIGGTGFGTMKEVPSAMVIIEKYTDENGEVWYYVDAVKGETWPTDCTNYHYVKASDVVIVEEDDDEEDQVQLSSGGITISGADIPEGAQAVVSDLTATVNPGDGVSIFDISVQSGGTTWQPEPGKTVKVTLPAPDGAETVNVVHFLEDAQQIQASLGGAVTTLDTSDAEPELLEVLAKAIAACKEATGQDNMVAVERFENVQVVDGCVKVDSSGFSIYAFWEDEYRELPNDWEALEDMNTGTVYYIKQGGEFRLVNSKGANWDDYYDTDISVKINDGGVGGSVSRDKSLFGWTKDDIVFKVPDNSSIVGREFIIRYRVEGEQDKTIKIQVISKDTEVEGIDNESVYIGIYKGDGFPSEPTASMSNNYSWYLANGQVDNSSEKEYAETAAGLIYKNRFEESSLKIQSGTVTAIVDNAGVSTLQYAKINDNFKQDILQKMGSNPEENTLLIYAVKKIVSGNNVKWYVMTKIVPNNSNILSYDINWPAEIPIPSNVIMPNGGSFQSGAEVTIKYPSDAKFSVTVGNITYDVNFLGWDTDKNAKDPSIEYNEDCQMTMTEDLTLYAVWTTDYEYKNADIEFYNHVVDESNNTITTNTEFIFTVGESLYKNNYNYKIYDKHGVLKNDGTFSESNQQFTLAAEQHIIIESVLNNSYEIELISTVGYGVKASSGNGYSIDANGATSINITSETNTTGKLYIDFYNVLQTYTVTYDYNGVTVDGAPTNQTYTIEDTFNLLNPSKTGYTFNGWKVTQKDATSNWNNDIYAGGTSMSNMYGNVTLTAQWMRNTYTVTWNVDGETTTETYNYGTTIVPPTPTKAGYTFTGWSGYTAGMTMPDNDVVFVAQWQVNIHTVIWNVDGITTTETYNYGATINLPTAPTKEGYTFTGWSGYTTSMTMPNEDITFTAQWQINSVDLTIKTTASDAEQSFIFNVDGTAVSGEKIKLSVVLVGNDVQKIVNLPAGTYTVSNQQGWSWRYNTVSSQEATIYSGSEVMEFNFGTPSKIYWLDGNAWRKFFFNK